jgi:hypothetical protein
MEDRGHDNRLGVALKHFLCPGRTSTLKNKVRL